MQVSFDLILEQTFFCALPVQKRTKFAEKIKTLLDNKGKFAGILFDKFPAEGPPYGGSQEEYFTYFEPYFKIEVMETCYNSYPPRQGKELFFIFKKN